MNNHNPENSPLIKELSAACDGLLWLSESDSLWQVVYWQNEQILNKQVLLERYNYPAATKVITKKLLSFFESAITEQEWHDEMEKNATERYQNLYYWLINNLQDIQVFLIGEIELDVYILGKTGNHSIIGLSTKIIET